MPAYPAASRSYTALAYLSIRSLMHLPSNALGGSMGHLVAYTLRRARRPQGLHCRRLRDRGSRHRLGEASLRRAGAGLLAPPLRSPSAGVRIRPSVARVLVASQRPGACREEVVVR